MAVYGITGAGVGRGAGNTSAGGAYSFQAMQDLVDGDAFQAQPTLFSGTADAINIYSGNNNNIVTRAGVDATTLPAPVAGKDDNLTIAVWSNTAFAHTITCPSAIIQNGAAALRTSITFPAFAGAGVLLRAYNGNWQVVGGTGTLVYA
jgi:hypothetical protein